MPTKNTVGINRIKKIKPQISSDAKREFIFLFKKLYSGLKIPLTTAAKTITDIKGQKSQPRKKADNRKRAKKNHKIILWEVLSGIGHPIKKNTFSDHR
jgi:hypothetical protein